jgi:multidrug efflux pump subunit AcrA (membrane-fusion protein)
MNNFTKKRGFVVISILVVLAILISAYFLNRASGKNNNYSSNADNIYEVKTGDIELSQEGVATLVASKETNLYFNQVSGVLQSINIKVNDDVTAGQVIGEISSDDINNQIQQAAIDDKIANVNAQKIDLAITNMNKSVELSKIDLDSSANTVNRTKSILNSIKSPTTNEEKVALNTAQADYDKAVKENQKAKLVYEQNLNQLTSLKLEKQNANNTASSRALKTQALQKSLENCKLVANTPGKVTFVDNVSLKDFIVSGRVIAKIVEQKNFVLQFKSTNISDFTSGMKLKLKINGDTYNGAVYEPASGDLIKPEDSSVQNKTLVYFSLEEQIKSLNLGDRTSVSVSTEKKENVIVVPKSAVTGEGDRFTVKKYNDGKIETVEIVKGIETDSNVEVKDGLKVGDKIVVGY